MSATSDAMNQIATNLVRLARRPGLLLVVGAAVPVALFALFSFLVGRQAETGAGWTLFVLALLCAVPIVVLAVRRERLRRRTGGSGDAAPTVGGGVVDTPAPDGADPRVAALRNEMGTWDEALSETRLRTARWLPRVEAAQRALERAAGGIVNAPYLRDDLRVTLVALLGTLAAIPLGVLGTFASVIILLVG